MTDGNLSRRNFIKTSATAGAAASAAAGLLAAPAPTSAKGANQRLRIGFIGPGRRGFGAHVKSLVKLRKLGFNIDLTAVCDVYTVHRDMTVDYIKAETKVTPKTYGDYREMIGSGQIDAVCIATPDHWHAKQTIDSLNAGLHVYCEKPMTHRIDEAAEVIRTWKSSGQILQVGVQSTSSPIWDKAREMIDNGKLGKVVQFQTESARNGKFGMSRHNVITKEMTPQNVDWRRWLGVDEGLAPEMVFDRSTFGQWRCYWPFGYGMLTDLFVHRITGMLKATGLRYPGRVVGGGGIYLEYDDREVMDVSSLIADFHEGAQTLVSSTMVSEERKLDHLIRGHHGLMLFDKKSYTSGPDAAFQFIPERPQVTLNSKLKAETHTASCKYNFNMSHFANFIEAIEAGKPNMVNNDPELGAAAVMMVNLAVRSYREGKVFQIDRDLNINHGDNSWAEGWEKISKAQGQPHHVPGWKAGNAGSEMFPPAYQKLAGPWIDGKDPAES